MKKIILLSFTVLFIMFNNTLNCQTYINSDTITLHKMIEKENAVGFISYYRGDTLISKEFNYIKKSFPFFRFKLLKEGIYYSFYTNGKIKEVGAFHKGKPMGFWKSYFEDGRIEEECMYNRRGKLIKCKNYLDLEK